MTPEELARAKIETTKSLAAVTGLSKLESYSIVRDFYDTCTCKDCQRRDKEGDSK